MRTKKDITRTIASSLRADLKKKMVLLAGPRQVGKTTLAKNLVSDVEYLNFDIDADRKMMLAKQWRRDCDLLVLDEVHKMHQWKAWLKGIYDKEPNLPILVTGSARLDVAKKMGDSLAGRHFNYHLYPLDLKELRGVDDPERLYQRLLKCSGFPEPFFEGSESFYTKWKRSHLDLILRQDLIQLETVRDITGIETLVLLMQSRVASPLSSNSLREDLKRDVKTVIHWIQQLEKLFVVFRVSPYSKNIASSVLKEAKYYFYDICRVDGDEGIKFENLVALALKKEVDYLNDTLGIESSLQTLRKKGGTEIDFLVLRKNRPAYLIEVKLTDTSPSKSFAIFDRYFPKAHKIQLVKNLDRERATESGIQIKNAIQWLSRLDLSKD